MAEVAVIDASPLIFLARSRHLELLQGFAPTVWVPAPVAAEIARRGNQDITALAIENTAWLITQPAPDIPAGHRRHDARRVVSLTARAGGSAEARGGMSPQI